MPLLAVFDSDALFDGRQSDAALAIRRGTARRLRDLGFAVLPEVTLRSGRRADLVALGPEGEIWIVEIKSSVADFQSDTKWPHYKSACDRFFFATSPEVGDIFPASEGLIIADAFDAEIVRDAAAERLSPQARRALTMRLAQIAARRLHELEDPSPRGLGDL